MATIEEIDTAFSKYYESLGKPYNSIFLTFCSDNGYDQESIQNDIEEDVDESELVEFDEDFPFENTPKKEQDKRLFIHQMLKKFYHNHTNSKVSRTTNSVIQSMDNSIRKYYNWHNQLYIGQFARYCEENGYYSDGMGEELDDIDTDLIHFDDHFPVPTHVSKDSEAKYIRDKLKLFHKDPTILYPKQKVILFLFFYQLVNHRK